MRWIAILFLLFVFRIANAQNYRNIPVHGNLYFIDSLNYIFPIDPDSIKFENGDSVIYHFKSLRQSAYNDTNYRMYRNYDLNVDSWAGSKTIILADQSTIWFAKNNDSILIKNQAKKGEIWLVNNKRQTFGKVTDHVLKTFLAITDSVKYITIGSLNTITGEVYGREFWLSKNFGFIKMYDIYNFYVTSTIGVDINYLYTDPVGNISLIGSNLISGTKTKLTERMVNDFDVGDEFHKTTYYSLPASNCDPDFNYFSYINTENQIIKSKTVDTNQDSVFYEVQSCGKVTKGYTIDKSHFSFNNIIILKLSSRDIGDTPLKVNLTNQIAFAITSGFNNKFVSTLMLKDGMYVEKILDFCNVYCYQNNDTVTAIERYDYSEFDEVSYNFITDGSKLIEGTGTGYFDEPAECSSRSYSLDYVKKGITTLGTPHDFNCDTLSAKTVLGINDASLKSTIEIYPNPFSEKLTIKSTEKIQKVNIYTTQIQLVKSIQINDIESSLSLNELPPGLYIAEVILADQRKAQYKIIKSD